VQDKPDIVRVNLMALVGFLLKLNDHLQTSSSGSFNPHTVRGVDVFISYLLSNVVVLGGLASSDRRTG
jgi:hypothetical protein